MSEHATPTAQDNTTLELATEIISAYVSHNVVPVADLPNLISNVFGALTNAGTKKTEMVATEVEQKPAVSIRKSVNDDAITCLECGNNFKSLKRHLMTHHGQTPEEYRNKWKLAADYPMVAPAYANKRSELAKSSGLGQNRRKKAA